MSGSKQDCQQLDKVENVIAVLLSNLWSASLTGEVSTHQRLPVKLRLLQATCMDPAIVAAGLVALAEEETDPARHPMPHPLGLLHLAEIAHGRRWRNALHSRQAINAESQSACASQQKRCC